MLTIIIWNQFFFCLVYNVVLQMLARQVSLADAVLSAATVTVTQAH